MPGNLFAELLNLALATSEEWLFYMTLLCDRLETNNNVDNSVKHKPIIVEGPTNM